MRMDASAELDYIKSSIENLVDDIEHEKIASVKSILDELRYICSCKVIYDGDDYLINVGDKVYTSFNSEYIVLAVSNITGLVFLNDNEWHNPTSFYKKVICTTKDGVDVTVGDTVYDGDVECVLEEYVGDGLYLAENDCDPIAVRFTYSKPRCVSKDGCVVYEGDYVYDKDGNRQIVFNVNVDECSVQLKNSGWCPADMVYMKPHFPDEASLLHEFERLSIEHTDSTIYEMFDAAKQVFGGNNG